MDIAREYKAARRKPLLPVLNPVEYVFMYHESILAELELKTGVKWYADGLTLRTSYMGEHTPLVSANAIFLSKFNPNNHEWLRFI